MPSFCYAIEFKDYIYTIFTLATIDIFQERKIKKGLKML